MHGLEAGAAFPQEKVAVLGSDSVTLGRPGGGHDWQMVVVYRGLHCPICKKYLKQLDEMTGEFSDLGVDVLAVSGDPQEKAQALMEETGVKVPLGYGLTVAQMRKLGLYVSAPRSPQETDRPFAEPGLFVINGAGAVQIVDISNAPFARPDLQGILNGIRFIRDKDYPVRGTHAD